jgi:hypothetical protein
MRFVARNGYIDLDVTEAGMLVVSATELATATGETRIASQTVLELNANHGEAVAVGVDAGCRELRAKEVDL